MIEVIPTPEVMSAFESFDAALQNHQRTLDRVVASLEEYRRKRAESHQRLMDSFAKADEAFKKAIAYYNGGENENL